MPATELRVRWRGKVVLGGPKGSEEEARQRLYDLLYDELSRCEYLNLSMRDDKYATAIAQGDPTLPDAKVPYQVGGKKIVVRVELDFWYRNPPGPWKSWATVSGEGEED